MKITNGFQTISPGPIWPPIFRPFSPHFDQRGSSQGWKMTNYFFIMCTSSFPTTFPKTPHENKQQFSFYLNFWRFFEDPGPKMVIQGVENVPGSKKIFFYVLLDASENRLQKTACPYLPPFPKIKMMYRQTNRQTNKQTNVILLIYTRLGSSTRRRTLN